MVVHVNGHSVTVYQRKQESTQHRPWSRPEGHSHRSKRIHTRDYTPHTSAINSINLSSLLDFLVTPMPPAGDQARRCLYYLHPPIHHRISVFTIPATETTRAVGTVFRLILYVLSNMAETNHPFA